MIDDPNPPFHTSSPNTHRLREAEQEQLSRTAPTNIILILYSPNVPVKPKASALRLFAWGQIFKYRAEV